jgi:hypothetical protein
MDQNTQVRLDNIDHNFRQMTALMEQMRREQPSIDASPLVGAAFEKIAGQVDVVDYSTACSMIDAAISHLDEGLPNGQVVRCSVAMTLLLTGVTLLNRWMSLKGYCTHGEDLSNLMNGVTTAGAELRIPATLIDSRIPEARKLISGQHLEVKEEGNGIENFVVTSCRSVESAKSSGLSLMQMTYQIFGVGSGPEPRPKEIVQTKVVSHHEVHNKDTESKA